MKNVIITGSTGMVGNLILQRCLADDSIASVKSVVRKPTDTSHPKLQEIVIQDMMSYEGDQNLFKDIDIMFFCIGVYTGAVSAEQFRKINVDIPMAFANVLKAHSPHATFCLLSGRGADRKEKSRIQFARDKGAVENQIEAVDFGNFYTFRPGYIYPVTKRVEPNVSYRIFRSLYPVLKYMGKNTSIKSTELADAMVNVGLSGASESILDNRDILKYA